MTDGKSSSEDKLELASTRFTVGDKNFDYGRWGDLTKEKKVNPSKAPRDEQKEYFKALSKSIVDFDPIEEFYFLTFYAGEHPGTSDRIPLQIIKTVRSEDDNKYKFSFAFFCGCIAFLSAACLFSTEVATFIIKSVGLSEYCPAATGFLEIGCAETGGPIITLLAAGIVLAVWFSFVRTKLITNFTEAGKEWETAIADIFAPDLLPKMMGIRRLMLSFRQFIKWRRFSNFFPWIFSFIAGPIYTIVVGVAALPYVPNLSTPDWLAAASGGINAAEAFAAVCLFGGLVLAIRWFERLKLKYTEWRDPTVQLCVSLAELHKRLVDVRNIGGSGT